MKIGTKSLLFGVHQFLFHPYTIIRAWRKCYRRWPRWWELVAIICHDWGYWGKPNMDGVEGQRHPEGGASITESIVFWLSGSYHLAFEAYQLALFHSTHYATSAGQKVSRLYLPDKMSVLYDPKWFYLFRGWLSDEVSEYVKNAPVIHTCHGNWFDWYRSKIENKLKDHLTASGKAS